MAAITVSSSGLWSVVVGASDGDSVTIPAGYTVIFDVDQSGWSTGLTGLTGAGTLKFKTDANTCLMMATNTSITVSNFGNSESDRIDRPDTGKQYRCKIILKGSGTLPSGTLLYGWVPDQNYTYLAEAASLSATEIILNEELDLQQGDQIVIGSGNENGAMAEANKGVYTVQSYNSSTKTVTLTGGLQTARLANDYVALLSRTIEIERTPAASSRGLSTANSLMFEGVRFIGLKGPQGPSGWSFSFCTLQNGYYGIVAGGAGHFINDCTGQNISNYGLIYGASGSTVLNSIAFNCVKGFVYQAYTNYLYTCVSQNNPSFVDSGFNCFLANCVSKNSGTADLNYPYECILYDGKLESAVQVAGYRGISTRKWINTESYGHNEVPSNYRAWMKGGYILTDTSFVHGSAESSLKFVIEEDTPLFRDYYIYAPKNKTIKFKLHGYKDFSGGTVKAQIIDPQHDPMIDSSQVALAETSMSDVSSAWTPFKVQYKSDYTKLVILRILVQNSTGNVWFDITDLEMMLATKKVIVM